MVRRWTPDGLSDAAHAYATAPPTHRDSAREFQPVWRKEWQKDKGALAKEGRNHLSLQGLTSAKAAKGRQSQGRGQSQGNTAHSARSSGHHLRKLAPPPTGAVGGRCEVAAFLGPRGVCTEPLFVSSLRSPLWRSPKVRTTLECASSSTAAAVLPPQPHSRFWRY